MKKMRSSLDVNVALGAHGAGELVQAGDKVYSLCPAVQAIQADFTAWLKMRARQELIGQRGVMPKAEYDRQHEQMTRQFAFGTYNWGGDVMLEALQHEDGQTHLLYLMLRVKQPDVQPGDVQDIIAKNVEGFALALQAALHAGDPKHFSPPKKAESTGNKDQAENEEVEEGGEAAA